MFDSGVVRSPRSGGRRGWRRAAYLAVAMLFGCGASPPQPAATFTTDLAIVGSGLSGQVVDAETGEAIAGAVVSVTGGNQALTRTDGIFTLTGISRTPSLSVSRSGFRSRTIAIGSLGTHPVIALPEAFPALPYVLSGSLDRGQVTGNGRVSVLGDQLFLATLSGNNGDLSYVSLQTGSEQQHIEKLSWFSALPADLADVAGLPQGGAALLDARGLVQTFDGQGRHALSAQISSGPGALACDGRTLYVAERGTIHRVGLDLQAIGDWRIGPYTPTGLALDSLDNVYMSTDEGAILEFDAYGHPLEDWPDSGARAVGGIAIDRAGHVLVSDPDGHRVVVLAPDGTPAGVFGMGELESPRGIAIGTKGNVYVADVGQGMVAAFAPPPGH